MVEQGEIINISGIEQPFLVVSATLYNTSGHLIACPIVNSDEGSTFCMRIDEEHGNGFVLCDSPQQFDWKSRGYSPRGHLSLSKLIVILDMIQSLFDYTLPSISSLRGDNLNLKE